VIVVSRPIRGLTLAAINDLGLPALDGLSLRELVVAVESDETCQPTNPGQRERGHRAPRRYAIPAVERAARKYRRVGADN
jgi:hypothetical protein